MTHDTVRIDGICSSPGNSVHGLMGHTGRGQTGVGGWECGSAIVLAYHVLGPGFYPKWGVFTHSFILVLSHLSPTPLF